MLKALIGPTATSAWPNAVKRGFATSTIRAGIQVERMAGGCGAEISNIDVRQLDSSAAKDVRQALLDNLVLFFRKQDLEPSEFVKFTSFFGQPVEYPFVKGIEGFPEVIEVLKKETETGANFGGVWHSDTTYLPEPPMGSVLLAREIPAVGGDTLWANQYLAYESLSDGLKKSLEPLKCVQSSAKADASKTREDRIKDSGRGSEHMEQFHPAVRTHPETGKKALFVNVAHTVRFDGWSEDESRPLLQYLHKHQVKPEFTCRLRWEPGTIAFWDNRCTQHYPLNDYHGYRRRMHRITLAGDKPV
ncbi:hypothetical protein BST61_g2685 [Cercospora zeina]